MQECRKFGTVYVGFGQSAAAQNQAVQKRALVSQDASCPLQDANTRFGMSITIPSCSASEREKLLGVMDKALAKDKSTIAEIYKSAEAPRGDFKVVFVRSAPAVPKKPQTTHSKYVWSLMERAFGTPAAKKVWDRSRFDNYSTALVSDSLNEALALMELHWRRPQPVATSGHKDEQEPEMGQEPKVASQGQTAENQPAGKPLSGILTAHYSSNRLDSDTIQATPTELQQLLGRQQAISRTSSSNSMNTQDIHDHAASLEFPPVAPEEDSDGSMPSLEFAPPPSKKPKLQGGPCEYFARS